MSRVVVDIAISSDEFQKAYQGVEYVFCYARDGRSIRFPCKILWPFISREGIYGTFEIEFSSQGKFEDIRRIE